MYTNVSKPVGASYTNLSKPTGASYTNISKPTGGSMSPAVVAGMTMGLLIPLTTPLNIAGSMGGGGWTNIAKPT